jgi:tetratricopeptide (TPR) repeat protein/predicted Ser/Thr protein kinase
VRPPGAGAPRDRGIDPERAPADTPAAARDRARRIGYVRAVHTPAFPSSADAPPAHLGGSTAPYAGDEEPFQPLRGRVVDRYMIVDELGAGGMGVVYKAYDPDLGRLIALKLVRPSAASRATIRLVREARAIARLAHPNVVAVHDVGELDAEIFIAMEYVEGERLRDWLNAPRPLRAILDAFLQAARGLGAAHDAGLVHRDFKPDNVLVGLDGRVRVVDFGLAREARDDDPIERLNRDGDELFDSGPDTPTSGDPIDAAAAVDLGRTITPTGAAVGTPRYMAPEQHLGRDCDARADQFAWGVALYEALTRQRPFDGSGKQLRKSVLLGELRPFPASAGVPEWLQAVVVRALSVAPAARFGSMHEVIAELTDDRGAHRRAALDGSGNTEPMVAAFPPPDEHAARVHRLRGHLEQAWSKKSRGAYAAALAMARQIAADAIHIDYLPLQAAALYLRGNLEHRTGDSQEAVASLYEAARVAARAGDDWQVANTWIFLVQVQGVGLGHTAEADTIARVAEVALDRVGDNASLRSRLWNYWGAALAAGGRHADAAAQIERAVDLDAITHGEGHAFVTVSLLNLAETWLDGERPDQARQPLERARALCQPEERAATASRTRCLALYGRLLVIDGDLDRGQDYLEAAIKVWEKQPGRDAALADALVQLAICARAKGDLLSARAHAERAALLATTIGAPRLVERAERQRALAAAAAAGRAR